MSDNSNTDNSNTEKTNTKQKQEWIEQYNYATKFAFMAESKITLEKDEKKAMNRYKRILEKIREKNSISKHTYHLELFSSELDDYFKSWKQDDVSLVKTTSPPWIFECDCNLVYTKNDEPLPNFYIPFGKIYNLLIKKRRSIPQHNLPETMLYHLTKLMSFFVKPETKEFLLPTISALGIAIKAEKEPLNIPAFLNKFRTKMSSGKLDVTSMLKDPQKMLDDPLFKEISSEITGTTGIKLDDNMKKIITNITSDMSAEKLGNMKKDAMSIMQSSKDKDGKELSYIDKMKEFAAKYTKIPKDDIDKTINKETGGELLNNISQYVDTSELQNTINSKNGNDNNSEDSNNQDN